MMRKVNKGVSFVEVLIALAIFMILMVPLVLGLVSGMKTTTTGKELQYRNEYAQNLMENMKELPIEVLDKKNTSYFEKMGSSSVAIKYAKDDTKYNKTNAAGTTTSCPYEQYVVTGKTYLGTERTEYSYAIEMSSAAYAKAQQDNGSMNPNNLTSGIVENLDQNKVALISATLANYDSPAYDALLTKKMSELRKRQEENGIAYDPVNNVNLFNNDIGSRIINIALKGNKADGYDVTCTLYYADNCQEAASTASGGGTIGKVIGTVSYTPYLKHFDELPNIYLMYNVGVYNGKYTNDYITYDLSGVDEKEEVNVFVVETASNYSSDVVSTDNENISNGGKSWLKGSSDALYRKAGTTERDNVKIGMALLDSGLTTKKLNNFHVYHNMAAPLKEDYATESEYNAAYNDWITHKKNVNVACDGTVATEVQNLFNSGSNYSAVDNVKTLNKAQEGIRGLYVIKIWMQEGALDAATLMKGDPVLQGTRGGGEVE